MFDLFCDLVKKFLFGEINEVFFWRMFVMLFGKDNLVEFEIDFDCKRWCGFFEVVFGMGKINLVLMSIFWMFLWDG